MFLETHDVKLKYLKSYLQGLVKFELEKASQAYQASQAYIYGGVNPSTKEGNLEEMMEIFKVFRGEELRSKIIEEINSNNQIGDKYSVQRLMFESSTYPPFNGEDKYGYLKFVLSDFIFKVLSKSTKTPDHEPQPKARSSWSLRI